MSDKYKYCPLCSSSLIVKKELHDEHNRLTCSKCSFVFYQNPTPTVLAIIEQKDDLLLVKRKNDPKKGFWTLPGGFVEMEQNLETALRTEILEEIGVKIKSFSYFGSYISQYKALYILEDVVCVAFRVEVESVEFKVGSDVANVKFFPKNNLPKTAFFRDVQSIVKQLTQK